MQFDHTAIVTADLKGTHRFFAQVVGLDDGARPPFKIDGYWMYADGRPLIHLVRATLPSGAGRYVSRVDHIALRAANSDAWGRRCSTAWKQPGWSTRCATYRSPTNASFSYRSPPASPRVRALLDFLSEHFASTAAELDPRLR